MFVKIVIDVKNHTAAEVGHCELMRDTFLIQEPMVDENRYAIAVCEEGDIDAVIQECCDGLDDYFSGLDADDYEGPDAERIALDRAWAA